MRRLMAMLLTLVMVFSLVCFTACNGMESTEPTDHEHEHTEKPTGTEADTGKETEKETEKETDAPHEHTPGSAVSENIVEATCTAKGSYDEVVYCSVCDEELSRVKKEIDKKAHTFDKKVVDDKYIKAEATCEDEATYYYSCVCGEKGSESFNNGESLAHTFDKKVVDDKYKKSDATCTEKAVYYYSCECGAKGEATFEDGEFAHKYDKTVATDAYKKSDATCTSKAVYYKSCECGAKGSDTFEYGDVLAHTPAAAVRENEIAAACNKAGSYDEVVYCSNCPHEISRTPVTTSATGVHVYNKMVASEANKKIAATCTSRAVYYKTCVCGAKGSETFEAGVFADHTPANAVRENEVAATCGAAGSYDEVIYCSNEECDVEISRTTKPIPATGNHNFNKQEATEAHKASNATCTKKATYYYSCECGANGTATFEVGGLSDHTPANAVRENEVAATCGVAGSYDEVIYCSNEECNFEISRTPKTIDATGNHNFNKQVATDGHKVSDATCTKKAIYYYSCECGANGSETFEYGELAAHTPAVAVRENEVAATCNKAGSYDEVVYCSKAGCGAEISRTLKTIDATGVHVYDQMSLDEQYKKDPATHTSKATYYYSCKCGAKGTEVFEHGDPIAHVYDRQVATDGHKASEATCTKKATYYYSCECGANGTTTFEAGEFAAHTPVVAVRENEVAATCGKAGSYDEVVYCSKCPHEISRTPKTIDATGNHNFNKQVATDGYKASDATCTKKATYYYSCECGANGTTTFESGGFAAHTPATAVRENEVAATCGTAGSYDEVVYCSNEECDVEISRTRKPIPATGDHNFNKQVATEGYKATDATCTKKATYYYSCECGAKGSETFEAGGFAAHTPATAVRENEVAATCGKAGSYDEVVYCSKAGCGAEISRTTKTTDATGNHNFNKQVATEGYKATDATCTKKATYYYSCECGAKGTATFEAGEFAAHTPAAAVRENEVAATCNKAGSYDEVVYCSKAGCGAEISRTPKTIDATGNHNFNKQVATDGYKASEATCTKKATYYYSCECGAKGTATFEAGELAAHTPAEAVQENYLDPTYFVTGSYDSVVYCSKPECRHEISRTPETIPVKNSYMVDETYMPEDVFTDVQYLLENGHTYQVMSYGNGPFAMNDIESFRQVKLTSISIPVYKTLAADENGDFKFTISIFKNDLDSVNSKKGAVRTYTIKISGEKYGLTANTNPILKFITVDLNDYDLYIEDDEMMAFGLAGDTLFPAYLEIEEKKENADNPNTITSRVPATILSLLQREFPQIIGFSAGVGTNNWSPDAGGSSLLYNFTFKRVYDNKAEYDEAVEEEEEFEKMLSTVADAYTGKYLSVFGDSISTFTGISNNTAYNSTIGSNAIWYNYSGQGGLYSHLYTYWGNLLRNAGMNLCVNNAWSGDSLGSARYVNRAVNLHNKSNVQPDLILAYFGINDIGGSTNRNVGNLLSLLENRGDKTEYEVIDQWFAGVENNAFASNGNYVVANTPDFDQLYALMLSIMTARYDTAKIACVTLVPNPGYPGSYDLVPEYNKVIRALAGYFGLLVVEQGNVINTDNYMSYMHDYRVLHPNAAGHEQLFREVVRTLYADLKAQGYEDVIIDKSEPEITLGGRTEQDGSYTSVESFIDPEVFAEIETLMTSYNLCPQYNMPGAPYGLKDTNTMAGSKITHITIPVRSTKSVDADGNFTFTISFFKKNYAVGDSAVRTHQIKVSAAKYELSPNQTNAYCKFITIDVSKYNIVMGTDEIIAFADPNDTLIPLYLNDKNATDSKKYVWDLLNEKAPQMLGFCMNTGRVTWNPTFGNSLIYNLVYERTEISGAEESYLPADTYAAIKDLVEVQKTSMNAYSFGVAPFSLLDNHTLKGTVLTEISLPIVKLGTPTEENGESYYTFTLSEYRGSGNNYGTNYTLVEAHKIKIPASEFANVTNKDSVYKFVTVDLKPYNIKIEDDEILGFGASGDNIYPGYVGSGNAIYSKLKADVPDSIGFSGCTGTADANKHTYTLALVFDLKFQRLYTSVADKEAAEAEKQELEAMIAEIKELYSGKKLSVFGDSISTFDGVSNSTDYNTTIGSNVAYYKVPGGGQFFMGGVYDYTMTYWGRMLSGLDMELCVNNSWGGGSFLSTTNSFIDRAQNLHNDTGDNDVNPDVIVVYYGFNNNFDAQPCYKLNELVASRGNKTVEQVVGPWVESVIEKYETGLITTETAKNYGIDELYTVMLYLMMKQYPDAEIVCIGLTDYIYRGDACRDAIVQYNKAIKALTEYFDIPMVNQKNVINATNYTEYTMDGEAIHPNAAGFKVMYEEIVRTLYAHNNPDENEPYVGTTSYMPESTIAKLKDLVENEGAFMHTYSYGVNPFAYKDMESFRNTKLTSITIPVMKTKTTTDGNFIFSITKYKEDANSSIGHVKVQDYRIKINAAKYGLVENLNSTVGDNSSCKGGKFITVDVTDYNIVIGENEFLGFASIDDDTLVPGYITGGNTTLMSIIDAEFPKGKQFAINVDTKALSFGEDNAILFDFTFEKTYANRAAYDQTTPYVDEQKHMPESTYEKVKDMFTVQNKPAKEYVPSATPFTYADQEPFKGQRISSITIPVMFTTGAVDGYYIFSLKEYSDDVNHTLIKHHKIKISAAEYGLVDSAEKVSNIRKFITVDLSDYYIYIDENEILAISDANDTLWPAYFDGSATEIRDVIKNEFPVMFRFSSKFGNPMDSVILFDFTFQKVYENKEAYEDTLPYVDVQTYMSAEAHDAVEKLLVEDGAKMNVYSTGLSAFALKDTDSFKNSKITSISIPVAKTKTVDADGNFIFTIATYKLDETASSGWSLSKEYNIKISAEKYGLAENYNSSVAEGSEGTVCKFITVDLSEYNITVGEDERITFSRSSDTLLPGYFSTGKEIGTLLKQYGYEKMFGFTAKYGQSNLTGNDGGLALLYDFTIERTYANKKAYEASLAQ